MRNILKLLIFCIVALLGCNEKEENYNPIKEGISQSLEEWLTKPIEEREPLESLDFSKESLTKSQAENVTTLFFQDRQATSLNEHGQQWNDRVFYYNGHIMPFYYQIFGNKPPEGRSLFISLHGGGGTTAAINDQQYENQKHLYDQAMISIEGVYLAPRAPTNTWNLWHQNHIDDFLNIIIQMAIAVENVNPNKVYLLGYSAGGDGVYQLAPRMADRWAAASMMAGHPNDASPLGLNNTPFAIHVGALDNAYDRNLKAQEWKSLLDDLENNAIGSYFHDVQLHDGLGHWMDLQDAVALPWMKNYERNPIPQKVVWQQDNRHHSSFYWIGIPENLIETGGKIIAEYNTQLNEINIISNYSNIIQLYINDKMLNLNDPIIIKYQGKVISQKIFNRSVLNIHETLSIKGDSELSFPCVLTVINNENVQE
jgi:predicted esterase